MKRVPVLQQCQTPGNGLDKRTGKIDGQKQQDRHHQAGTQDPKDLTQRTGAQVWVLGEKCHRIHPGTVCHGQIHRGVDPQKSLGIPDVLVKIFSLFYLQRIFCVEIGIPQSAGHCLGKRKAVAVDRCQECHHAAQIALLGRVGEHKIQLAQLQPAHTHHGAVISPDGNHQYHHIFPGAGQADPLCPYRAFGQPLRRKVKHCIIARQVGNVKFQFPAVVQFQLMFPGHICNAAVKNDILVGGAFAAQVGQAEIQAGPGGLRPRRFGIGGGIQDQVGAAAGGGPQRRGKVPVQKCFQFPDLFRLVIERGNGVGKQYIAEGGGSLLGHGDALGGHFTQLVG